MKTKAGKKGSWITYPHLKCLSINGNKLDISLSKSDRKGNQRIHAMLFLESYIFGIKLWRWQHCANYACLNSIGIALILFAINSTGPSFSNLIKKIRTMEVSLAIIWIDQQVQPSLFVHYFNHWLVLCTLHLLIVNVQWCRNGDGFYLHFWDLMILFISPSDDAIYIHLNVIWYLTK